ncbi:piggyBac transposable element-derived protein 4-like [Pecten maximus]|uniref:piggyBac transposable element-derived protein 4-like n=1 Tax=Pecten maximus TaxID=6579 RepID=UPI0014589D57|nr:piggyBac transposable element-derived protein 4-like [Pecten maximus]
MTQYIPTKHCKFGIKLWMLVESVSGYIMHMSIYRGKRYDPTPAGQTQGSFVVFTLMEAADLLNKGYHLFTDGFFSSIDMAKRLLKAGTRFTGTFRANARGQPQAIKKPILNAGQAVYLRQGSILLCAYKEKPTRKPVRLISNCQTATVTNARQKPEMVNLYNRFMGGVDLNDQLTLTYDDHRKSVKAWKKVVWNMIHRISLNAYICYTHNTDRHLIVSRVEFIKLIVESLCQEQLDQRIPGGIRRRHNPMGVVPINGQRECVVCSRHDGNGRRRARSACRMCHRGLHAQCMNDHVCRRDVEQ